VKEKALTPEAITSPSGEAKALDTSRVFPKVSRSVICKPGKKGHREKNSNLKKKETFLS